MLNMTINDFRHVSAIPHPVPSPSPFADFFICQHDHAPFPVSLVNAKACLYVWSKMRHLAPCSNAAVMSTHYNVDMNENLNVS